MTQPTGVRSFDKSYEKTMQWLNEVGKQLDYDDPQKSYLALKAVLNTLRDRLPSTEVADLAAEMPLLIKGMYYDGWKGPGHIRKDIKTITDFNLAVAEYLGNDLDEDADTIREVVFRVLRDKISVGEMLDIEGTLPK